MLVDVMEGVEAEEQLARVQGKEKVENFARNRLFLVLFKYSEI